MISYSILLYISNEMDLIWNIEEIKVCYFETKAEKKRGHLFTFLITNVVNF